MDRKRILAAFAIAVTGAGLTVGLTMPVSNADSLPNGLTMTCSQDSDIHATCIIGGCPRVNGDYVVDAVHVTVAGQITNNESQHEYDFKCISGQTARQGVSTSPGKTETISAQGCRKNTGLGEHDWCGPWSDYKYTAPAAAAAPAPAAPPPPPVAPPPPPPPPPVNCSDGSTLPAGSTCPVKKVAPTNAVTMTVKKAGLQANVTVGNTSDLAADCTYDATEANGLGMPVHRDFSLAAKGSTTLNFPAPLPGQSYQIVASCNANFDGQTVQIGRAEGTA
jgi:hypothetical protein